jgi:hypothetical protein
MWAPQPKVKVIKSYASLPLASAPASFTLSQLGDFVLDALGDLTILALQLAQFKEFSGGFWRIAGYVTANRFNVFLDILKLLGEEDLERFPGVGAHSL